MDWQKGMNIAIDYIESNLAVAVDVGGAARLAGCSTWEFQRMFSFLTHVPLGEYIRRRKLALASHDLRTCEDKIIDIAFKYGYESPAAFTRAFTRQYGMAPKRVRENHDLALEDYPRITFELIEKERVSGMNQFGKRGYLVRENGPVYYTKDMDKTLKWFEDVLGWYGDIVARDSRGKGEYGCVFDYPSEVAAAHITPFRGFHMFAGEPCQGVAGFMMVDGLDALHRYVKEHGWDQISDIETQPWGARECRITTPDGCVLRFFEDAR